MSWNRIAHDLMLGCTPGSSALRAIEREIARAGGMPNSTFATLFAFLLDGGIATSCGWYIAEQLKQAARASGRWADFVAVCIIQGGPRDHIGGRELTVAEVTANVNAALHGDESALSEAYRELPNLLSNPFDVAEVLYVLAHQYPGAHGITLYETMQALSTDRRTAADVFDGAVPEGTWNSIFWRAFQEELLFIDDIGPYLAFLPSNSEIQTVLTDHGTERGKEVEWVFEAPHMDTFSVSLEAGDNYVIEYGSSFDSASRDLYIDDLDQGIGPVISEMFAAWFAEVRDLSEYEFSLDELEDMETISSSQADDLKFDADGVRVWLSRMDEDDGADYPNGATVEVLHPEDGWITRLTYQAR
jgi:hypothetical protein